jgi:histidyl-tRNA synthetase
MKNKYSGNDLSVEDVAGFRKLEKVFLNRCSQFGYQEIKTSTIEPLHIFAGKGVLSHTKLRRIYSFIDWDGWTGERVALRPDSSICVARFYNEHLADKKAREKLCYVENHFEYADSGDSISERWQCGVENIGESTPESDLEVIYMAYDILREINLKDFFLHLSYPHIVKEMINILDPDEKYKLEAAIKKDMELAKKILNSVSGGKDLVNLLTLCGESAKYLKNLKATLKQEKFQSIIPLIDNFISVCMLLDDLECPYRIDFSFSGNLEYYTGISFQILATALRKSNRDILCSGGRYDNLIKKTEKMSHPIRTTGFAFYVRNILKNYSVYSRERTQNICIYIGKVTKNNVKTGQILCNRFAKLGFKAKITFTRPEQAEYEQYGLVIHVDKEKFDDEYKILYSHKIGKPLLVNLFGELNAHC